MSVLFSIGVYTLVGLCVVAWLAAQKRLDPRLMTRVWAAVFWPAYLVVCLQPAEPERDKGASDPPLERLAERIQRMPVGEDRRREYGLALDRIRQALAARELELGRLSEVEARLREMGSEVRADSDQKIVGQELGRVLLERQRIEQDLARARAQVVGLAVRVEVFAVRSPRESLDSQLSAFEEDLDRLLHAQAEVG